jgi:hypothetical protein
MPIVKSPKLIQKENALVRKVHYLQFSEVDTGVKEPNDKFIIHEEIPIQEELNAFSVDLCKWVV